MTSSNPTQITLYVEIDENTGTRHWQHDVRHYKGLVVRARQRLAELRLVNKAFYHSVSLRLFRHVGVRPRLSNSSAKRRSAFFWLEKISESKYAEYVRGIDFWFHLSSQGRADRDYVSDLVSLLRPCFARFKNIRMLGFHEPHSDLPEHETTLYVSSIVALFRDMSFPILEELTIYFPLTYDYGRLFISPSPPQKIPMMNIPLQRLRHLEVGVYAYTNFLHVRYWTRPVRPEYADTPNEMYESDFYQMIEPAISLQSLSIRNKDHLNLDSLDFSPSLHHLRSLTLSAVFISADKLLSLFTMADQSTESKIKHIDFNIVKLSAGTWHHVLLGMSRLLPRLVEFKSESSGYSLIGSSADLVPVLPDRGFATTYSIETDEAVDIAALGHLQRVVNENRIAAGLEPYTEDDFEYLGEPPLDLIQQVQQGTN